MIVTSFTMTMSGFLVLSCDSQVFPNVCLTLQNTLQGPPMLDHDTLHFEITP